MVPTAVNTLYARHVYLCDVTLYLTTTPPPEFLLRINITLYVERDAINLCLSLRLMYACTVRVRVRETRDVRDWNNIAERKTE